MVGFAVLACGRSFFKAHVPRPNAQAAPKHSRAKQEA